MSLSRSVRSIPLHRLSSPFPPQNVAIRYFSSCIAQRASHQPGGGSSLKFFGRPRLPTNKGIMFVPQQEAWVGGLICLSVDSCVGSRENGQISRNTGAWIEDFDSHFGQSQICPIAQR
jgi:hypothetical protein